MLTAIAVGPIDVAVPLPRAGVHGIVLLAAAKEALAHQEKKQNTSEVRKNDAKWCYGLLF